MKNITTGVDKLLKLLEQKNRMSLEEATLKLEIDKETIKDWLELLEQEGLVKLEKNLSTTWIQANKIEVKHVENMAGEITSEKEAFTRKIEIAIKSLEKDTTGFEDIKKEFNEIQNHIKSELETVREDMNELQSYDKLKKNISTEIEEQKKQYEKFVKLYEKQIESYELRESILINKLEQEEKKVKLTEVKLIEFEKAKESAEKTIRKTMDELKNITDKMSKEMSEINDSKNMIRKLKEEIETFKITIQKNKEKQLKKIAEKISTEKVIIEKKHESLLRKARLTISELSDYEKTGKEIYRNFETLFGNKIKIKNMLDEIGKEKADLRNEMIKLEQKVKMFTLLKKDKDIKKQMKEIEKTIKSYEERKKGLISKILELTKIISS